MKYLMAFNERTLLRLGLCAALVCASKMFACCGGGNFGGNLGCCSTTAPSVSAPRFPQRSVFIPRSIGDDLVVMSYKHRKNYREDCFYGVFDCSYTYFHSRNPCSIANAIFPSATLTFTGSQVANRSSTALLADYFGMATTTNVSITFNPRIKYHRVNLGMTFGLDQMTHGLWLQANAPVVVSKWDLNNCCGQSCGNTCAPCTVPGTQTLPSDWFPFGYMDVYSTAAVPPFAPNFVTPTLLLSDALQGKAFGQAQAWLYGKFCGCSPTESKLATVDVKLGYNIIDRESAHFGIYAKYDAPTGTRMNCCQAQCLFRPVIGDDFHKLGGGLTGYGEFCWRNHVFSVRGEAYGMYLFDRYQVRSFDFVGLGPLSRYMLLKAFYASSSASPAFTKDTYAGQLINAINYTTRHAKVKGRWQYEAMIEFGVKNVCGFYFAVGADFYGRAAEQITQLCAPCVGGVDSFNYGFKGCAPVQVPGYVTQTPPPGETLTTGTVAAVYTLNSTQSNATQYACGTTDNAQTLQLNATATPTDGFIYVDTERTPRSVVAGITAGTAVSTLTPAQESSATPITVSTAGVVTGWTPGAVYINTAMLDLNSGAAPQQNTAKIYAYGDYYWPECDWAPHMYAGGEVEWGIRSAPAALATWGLFIGGGVFY